MPWVDKIVQTKVDKRWCTWQINNRRGCKQLLHVVNSIGPLEEPPRDHVDSQTAGSFSTLTFLRSIKIGPLRLCIFPLPLCVIDRDILAPVELFYCFMETVRGPRAACADDPVIMTPLMHLTTLHICSGMPSICLMGQQGGAGQSSLVLMCLCVFEFLFASPTYIVQHLTDPFFCPACVMRSHSNPLCFRSLLCVCVRAPKQTDTLRNSDCVSH